MIKLRQANEFSVLMTPHAFVIILFSLLCIILAALILQNPSLFFSLLFNPWTLAAKSHIILGLFTGLVLNTPLTAFILITTGFLTGAHITFARKHALLGTCSLLGVGCSVCGLSLFSSLEFFSLAFLPLGGLEFGILSVFILFLTLVFQYTSL